MGPVGTQFSRPRLSRKVETTDVGGEAEEVEEERTGSCISEIRFLNEAIGEVCIELPLVQGVDLAACWRIALKMS